MGTCHADVDEDSLTADRMLVRRPRARPVSDVSVQEARQLSKGLEASRGVTHPPFSLFPQTAPISWGPIISAMHPTRLELS